MMMGWGYGPGYWMHGMFGLTGPMAAIIQVIFWIIIITLGVLFFRRYRPRLPSSPSSTVSQSRALDILRERYAKGEIDSEEFQRRKHDLE